MCFNRLAVLVCLILLIHNSEMNFFMWGWALNLNKRAGGKFDNADTRNLQIVFECLQSVCQAESDRTISYKVLWIRKPRQSLILYQVFCCLIDMGAVISFLMERIRVQVQLDLPPFCSLKFRYQGRHHDGIAIEQHHDGIDNGPHHLLAPPGWFGNIIS